MANISSKAIADLDNKFKYNGKEELRREFSDLSGLEMYDFGARFYDPQLGSWHVLDPKADKYYCMSPFSCGADNPINVVDPHGKDIVYINSNGVEVHRGANDKVFSTYIQREELTHLQTHKKELQAGDRKLCQILYKKGHNRKKMQQGRHTRKTII